MTQYDNTNRGIVSKNTRKEKDTHPDIKGSINIEGVEYWLDGWQKQGSKGTFYSLSAKPKDGGAVRDGKLQPAGGFVSSGKQEPVKQAFALDDDIPFSPEFR